MLGNIYFHFIKINIKILLNCKLKYISKKYIKLKIKIWFFLSEVIKINIYSLSFLETHMASSFNVPKISVYVVT